MISDVITKKGIFGTYYQTIDENGKEIARKSKDSLGDYLGRTKDFILFRKGHSFVTYDENFTRIAQRSMLHDTKFITFAHENTMAFKRWEEKIIWYYDVNFNDVTKKVMLGNEYLLSAKSHMEKEEYNKAIIYYTEVIKLKYRLDLAYFNRAFAYFKQKTDTDFNRKMAVANLKMAADYGEVDALKALENMGIKHYPNPTRSKTLHEYMEEMLGKRIEITKFI